MNEDRIAIIEAAAREREGGYALDERGANDALWLIDELRQCRDPWFSNRPRSQGRTVHARKPNGTEIVRYDRQGKWFLESFEQEPISVGRAVREAEYAEVRFGLPGGSVFDRMVKAVRVQPGRRRAA